jgi:Major intrinsic protein
VFIASILTELIGIGQDGGVNESQPVLARRLFAEFLGTGLLVTVVVGSGIAAQRLSPNDVGLQLLENSTATVFGLAVLILMFGTVSGAHFNAVVSMADWFLGRRNQAGLSLGEVGAYTVVQCVGGIGGVVLANVMFETGAAPVHQAPGRQWASGRRAGRDRRFDRAHLRPRAHPPRHPGRTLGRRLHRRRVLVH